MGAYRKLPCGYFSESGLGIVLGLYMEAGSCSPTGVKQASGKKQAAGSGEDDDWICFFTAEDFQIALEMIPKASIEEEKKKAVEVPLEGSLGLK